MLFLKLILYAAGISESAVIANLEPFGKCQDRAQLLEYKNFPHTRVNNP